MQTIALTLVLLYVACLLWRDVSRRDGVSRHLWVVVLWAALVGSRPVSSWLGSGDAGLDSYDDGSPLESLVYAALMLYGLVIVWARRTRLGPVVSANLALVLLFAYWGLSVVWADLPIVALKRWVKDIGNLVMVLVALTERDPVQAVKATFVRCASILLPFSLLLIRFYPDAGRSYHVASGEMMVTGVTTHKNSLGMLVLVTGLFVFWDVLSRRRAAGTKALLLAVAFDGVLLAIAVMLLVQSASATALACTLVGGVVVVALRSAAVRSRILSVEIGLILLGALAWLMQSSVDLMGFVIEDVLGRDRTLTTRTDVWPLLVSMMDNHWLGAGFNSFWSGERLEQIYRELSIIQAHNGYIEIFLNGGYVGSVLLLAALVSAAWSLSQAVKAHHPFADIGLTVFVVTLLSNFTEASFHKMGLLWFVFLVAVVRHPGTGETLAAVEGLPAAPLAPDDIQPNTAR
jgi:exopolysaccharide production protein ExoQ